MGLRDPSSAEIRLLEFLLSGSDCSVDPKSLIEKIKVAEMNDGGMGSLRLFQRGSKTKDPAFGKRLSACQFLDRDGVAVMASLNLDQYGDLYELDLWKTDFGKLIGIPEDSSEFHREGQ